MILKVLDYKKSENFAGVLDVWNYFDNITSASNFFHEGTQSVVVRCTFRDGNIVTIDIPHEAYLMSDNGKTIERIVPRKEGVKPDPEGDIYPTLQDAVDYAMTK